MKYWLGIDIGTGGSRALVVDAGGKVVAGVTVAHQDMRMEQPLWAEQHPDDWSRAAFEAVRGALVKAEVTGSDIAGVGFSGQMHGLVLLDETKSVIRPALIWCDQRSQDQVDWMNSTAGEEFILEQTANPVLTGFTAPKLLWVRDHDPASYEKTRTMLLPKDYVRFRLTGEFAADVSDASGTALFDVVNRRWADPLISRIGVDRDILPAAAESSEVVGAVSEAAAPDSARDESPPRRYLPARTRAIGSHVYATPSPQRGLCQLVAQEGSGLWRRPPRRRPRSTAAPFGR